MLFFLASIQFLVLIYIILYEYRQGSASIFLWTMNLIVIGVGGILAIIIEPKYSFDTYIKGYIFSILFMSIYIITRVILNSFSKKRLIKRIQENLIKNNEIYINQIFKVLAFLSFLLFIMYSLRMFGNIFEVTWSNYVYTRPDLFSFEYFLSFFSQQFRFIAIPILFIYIYKKQKFQFFIYSIFLFLPFIFTRDRVQILPFFVIIILIFYVKNKKLTIGLIAKYFLLGVFILIFLYAFRIYRFYGSLHNFIDKFNYDVFYEQVSNLFKTNNGELGLIDAYYYFIENDNNFLGFGQMATYNRMLLFFVPTQFSFGLKHSDFAITMYSAYFNNYSNTVGSMHPTLIGDCYANAGEFGIFLGIFWAFFVKIIDLICYRRNILLSIFLTITWSYNYIIMARGAVYNGFINSIYTSILISLVFYFFKSRKKTKKKYYIQN